MAGDDILLFSYGTLRHSEVQLATCGRRLQGRADRLHRYRLAPFAISDPEVVRISGKTVHAIARRTGDPAGAIEGAVFRLTAAELAPTDRYEVDVYARVQAELASGLRAFVYAGPDLDDPSPA
jgi:hypothetical protein